MKNGIYSINPIVQNDIKYLLVTLKEGAFSDSFTLKIKEDTQIDRNFEVDFMNSYNIWQTLKQKERMPWSHSLLSELHNNLNKYKNAKNIIGGWY